MHLRLLTGQIIVGFPDGVTDTLFASFCMHKKKNPIRLLYCPSARCQAFVIKNLLLIIILQLWAMSYPPEQVFMKSILWATMQLAS